MAGNKVGWIVRLKVNAHRPALEGWRNPIWITTWCVFCT